MINELQFQLHPNKTYIGKISNGFNFLGYYMDDHKILPSRETIRRFLTRAAALYEQVQGKNVSRRYKKTLSRDISMYQVNEPAPTDEYCKNALTHLLSLAALKPDILATLRSYIRRWAQWLKLGPPTMKEFDSCLPSVLPS